MFWPTHSLYSVACCFNTAGVNRVIDTMHKLKIMTNALIFPPFRPRREASWGIHDKNQGKFLAQRAPQREPTVCPS